MGYSPWDCKELDTTEHMCVHACTRARAHTHRHTHTNTKEVTIGSIEPISRVHPYTVMEGHILDIVKTVFSMKRCLNRDPRNEERPAMGKAGEEHED